jgi:glutathione S-transferase
MADLRIIIGNKTYSSWSLRGWLAVHHTGLDYDEIKLQLDTPDFYSEIKKYTPVSKVPTLMHGDTPVWDSAAIIDYCARLAPEKNWWPSDNAAYAHARSIFNEMHSGFIAMRSHMPMNMRGSWSNMTVSDDVAKDIARADELFSDCRERFGANGDFLFGDFGAVDMMFAPICSRLTSYGVKLSDKAQAYVDAVLSYEAVKLWKADADLETDIVPIDEIPADATHLG